MSSGFLSSGSQSSSRRDKGKAPVRASKRPYEQLSSDALSHRHKMSKTYNPEPDIGPFCYQLDHATGPSRSSVTEVDPDLQEIDKSGELCGTLSRHNAEKCTDVFRQMVLVMYPATVSPSLAFLGYPVDLGIRPGGDPRGSEIPSLDRQGSGCPLFGQIHKGTRSKLLSQTNPAQVGVLLCSQWEMVQDWVFRGHPTPRGQYAGCALHHSPRK